MKKKSNIKSILKINDRIFLFTLIGQFFLVMIIFLLFGYFSYKSESYNIINRAKSLYHQWEGKITEALYIREIINSKDLSNIEVIKRFKESLKINGINAEVDIVECKLPNTKAQYIFSLELGKKKLKNCIKLIPQIAPLNKILPLMIVSLALFLFIAILSWIILRKFLIANVIKPLLEKIESDSRKVILGQVAAQVAHDVRSPLAALIMVTHNLDKLPEETRVTIRESVQRIKDIVNNLLNINKSIRKDNKLLHVGKEEKNLVVENLSGLIDSIITEKRLEFKEKIGLIIENQFDRSSYFLFAKINPVEFKRMISNLINNAVEAVEEQGMVTVSLSLKNEHSVIEIQDSGKGIPGEVIDHLMEEGKSYGKEEGFGLGLFHAKKTIELFGGKIHLKSEIGKGTRIILTLPMSQSPGWFGCSVPYNGHQFLM